MKLLHEDGGDVKSIWHLTLIVQFAWKIDGFRGFNGIGVKIICRCAPKDRIEHKHVLPDIFIVQGAFRFIWSFAKLSMGYNVQKEEANSDFRGSFKSIDTSIKLS